ncbi:MAG: Uma2 family endonuclease [Bacteroidota bacterium]
MTAEVLTKPVEKLYTLEEYFEHEELATEKSEFRNGKLVKIAGGTLAHSIIGSTINGLLLIISLARENLTVFDGDLKIYIPSYDQIVYSDGGIILDEEEMFEGGKQVLLNPTLIIEVLSDSTENYDRGGKFRKYLGQTHQKYDNQ